MRRIRLEPWVGLASQSVIVPTNYIYYREVEWVKSLLTKIPLKEQVLLILTTSNAADSNNKSMERNTWREVIHLFYKYCFKIKFYLNIHRED